MRSTTHDCELPHQSRPMGTQAVKFKDGMVITAEDLDTAMRYPLSVFQTLVRAYFGCGIVCGLKVTPVPPPEPRPGCPPAKRPLAVCIEPGVALGCDGYPIELCKPVNLDLTPDPCCDKPPTHVCIAIRRVTSDEQPRRDCGCGNGDCNCGKNGNSPRQQCTRIKEHVLIQAFDKNKPPRNLCALPKPNGTTDHTKQPGDRTVPPHCSCLKECEDCECCGEAWILLDCVIISDAGKPGENVQIEPQSRRKYVKPIQCLCPPARVDQANRPPPPQDND